MTFAYRRDKARNNLVDVILYRYTCAAISRLEMSLAIPTSRLDRMAITLSGLCLVHCLGTAVMFALLSAAGGILGSPDIHELGLTFAMVLGAVALGSGILQHGFMMPSTVGGLGLGVMAGALSLPHDGTEALYTVIGVGILALGHQLNRIANE